MRVTPATPQPAIADDLVFTTTPGGVSALVVLALADGTELPFHVYTVAEAGLHVFSGIRPGLVRAHDDRSLADEIVDRIMTAVPIGGLRTTRFTIPIRTTPGIAVAPIVAGILREAVRLQGLLAPLDGPQHYKLEAHVAGVSKPRISFGSDFSFSLEARNREDLERMLASRVEVFRKSLVRAGIECSMISIVRIEADERYVVRREPAGASGNATARI